ncbi:MAG TPA: hypothetical protein VMD53_07995 [Rhizomicrobium sp.]|nr:hypothetical protein [Rhizomicrobium sp.]
MIKAFLHRSVAKLEKRYDYDAHYLHDVIDVSPSAFFKFGLFQVMSSHRDGAPIDAYCAARIAATLSEDCGPCTQLTVDMALAGGVDPKHIAALLRGDLEQAGQDAELGFRYGIAVSQNTPNAVALSAEVARRYGKRALVSMAYGVACSRVYPALKRGLGHGAACSKINVSDETIVMRKAA